MRFSSHIVFTVSHRYCQTGLTECSRQGCRLALRLSATFSSALFVFLIHHPATDIRFVHRCELDDAVLTLEERGAPSLNVGGRTSSASYGGGFELYERLVQAVLGRDREASSKASSQETIERLLRVLRSQARQLTVGAIATNVHVPTPHSSRRIVLRTCLYSRRVWYSMPIACSDA